MISISYFSLQFFTMILSLTVIIHIMRTSPIFFSNLGSIKVTWREWIADQITTRFGVEKESIVARIAKIIAILTKYGVAAWAFLNFKSLNLDFWMLVWATLLALETMRKTAQYFIPAKWENVSLKLDSEHFWLINLVLLGVAEMHISTPIPYGLVTLIGFNILFLGESKKTLLAAMEDVSSISLFLIALLGLIKYPNLNFYHLCFAMSFLIVARGFVRTVLGRMWLKRKFWWIAQFCLMTSLIIKSLTVLNVLAPFNS
jgi:hypothetical protein